MKKITGNMGFFITGTSLKELFDDMQLKPTGFSYEDITIDTNWLLWLAV